MLKPWCLNEGVHSVLGAKSVVAWRAWGGCNIGADDRGARRPKHVQLTQLDVCREENLGEKDRPAADTIYVRNTMGWPRLPLMEVVHFTMVERPSDIAERAVA